MLLKVEASWWLGQLFSCASRVEYQIDVFFKYSDGNFLRVVSMQLLPTWRLTSGSITSMILSRDLTGLETRIAFTLCVKKHPKLSLK